MVPRTTGTGGSQTSGGTAGKNSGCKGSFGLGGSPSTSAAGGGRWLVRRSAVGGSSYEAGGGGSGFVWNSGSASNVPSGYSVSSSYYLTDAVTYAGNTSFSSTSGGTETGHSGNGYARITLVSGTIETTKEVTKTANRWNNIEDQTESGTFTGTFNYNGKEITETDTANIEIIHNGE